jgi:hypothetical protein
MKIEKTTSLQNASVPGNWLGLEQLAEERIHLPKSRQGKVGRYNVNNTELPV